MGWFDTVRKNLPASGVDTGFDNNFTPRALQVLALARQEADRMHHNFVGTEHLLLGLIKFGEGVAVNVLQRLGIDSETVRMQVENFVGIGPDQRPGGRIPYTPRLQKVFELANREAVSLRHAYVGTEHLLLGLLREGDGVGARVLKNLNMDTEKTRLEILQELDPNLAPGTKGQPGSQSDPDVSLKSSEGASIDTTKRYDLYCAERNRAAVVVYRNVLFKARKKLISARAPDFAPEFLELEQGDGTTVFISSHSIVKFCEHGTTPDVEDAAGEG